MNFVRRSSTPRARKSGSPNVAAQSRIAAAAVPGIVLLLAACSNSSGPRLASCSTPGTQLSLVPAADTSIDPASDTGCVTFAANASTIDSAEYLVLPQSGGGAAGSSAPFLLRSATPVTGMVMPQVAFISAGARRSSALAFDRFLREMGRTRSYPRLAPPAPSAAPSATAPIPSAAAGPPTVGSLRSFKCARTLRAPCSPRSEPKRSRWGCTSRSTSTRWPRHPA